MTLVARQFVSVDPIESEEDRKQTLATIGSLLDRADKIYSSLSQQLKPTLEAMLVRLNEQSCLDRYIVPSQPPLSGAAANDQSGALLATSVGPGGVRLTPLTVISSNGTSQMTITTSKSTNVPQNGINKKKRVVFELDPEKKISNTIINYCR